MCGIKSRFTWRSLEKSRGIYDFAGVDRVFEHAARLKKPAMLFRGDKSFSKDGVDVPDYIASEFDGAIWLDRTATANISGKAAAACRVAGTRESTSAF